MTSTALPSRPAINAAQQMAIARTAGSALGCESPAVTAPTYAGAQPVIAQGDGLRAQASQPVRPPISAEALISVRNHGGDQACRTLTGLEGTFGPAIEKQPAEEQQGSNDGCPDREVLRIRQRTHDSPLDVPVHVFPLVSAEQMSPGPAAPGC